MTKLSDELEDPAFVAKMELTQLRAGHVLDESDVAAIQALFVEMEEDADAYADAFGQGERKGREEAGGKEVADLLERMDSLKSEASTWKALSRFYSAEAGRLTLKGGSDE